MGKKAKEKQKNIITVVISICVLGVTLYLVYTNFIKKPNSLETSFFVANDPDEVAVEYNESDGKGLEEEIIVPDLLARLVKFGEWPVVVGDLGRSNPFLPR